MDITLGKFNFKKENKYYLENREKIIERQKEYNKLHRKKKGKLASKRDRVRLACKRNEKKAEEFRKSLLEDCSFGAI